MNDFIELRRILGIVLRRWWWLVIATVLAALVANVISRQQPPVYQATTTILVGDSIKSTSVDRTDIQVSEALVLTYVEIARRQPVLEGVVRALNLNESWQSLNDRIQVKQIESTQLIEIVVEANSPDMARMIADEIVNQMILLSPASTEGRDNEFINSFNREQIQSLQERIVNGRNRLAEIDTEISRSVSEIELADLQREKAALQTLIVEWEKNYTQMLVLSEPKRNPTQLTVIESAHSNNRQIRPRMQLNTALGGIVGLVIALGMIFLLDFLDDTYKSLSDFSQSEEVNILGSIRKIKGRKLADKIVAQLQPYSPVTESYRIVRSRIRLKPADKTTHSIMVTSSMPKEGKSVTVANLATVFAQANYRTIIVDADLRHPVLHDVFNVSNEAGLGDLLSSPEISIEDCLRDTSVTNLRVLTSGMPLLDPSERLGSKRMEEILAELRNVAEIIIFDTPPVLIFADAIVLSRRVDGVIVVIQAGKTKRAALTQALFDLQNANANLLGSIFNQSPQSDSFSVNKAYMQERPQLPARRQPSVKKETAAVGQFHDLREAATPLSESLPLNNSETASKENEIHEMAGVVEPEHEEEVVKGYDAVASLNESFETDRAEPVVEETQFTETAETVEPEPKEDVVEMHDAVTFGSLELEPEESVVEETQLDTIPEAVELEHKEEVADLRSSESEAEVKEKELASAPAVNLDHGKSRKRRSRKNRANGNKNEEVHDGQISTSIYTGANFPKNGNNHALADQEANAPVEQTTVLPDRTEE